MTEAEFKTFEAEIISDLESDDAKAALIKIGVAQLRELVEIHQLIQKIEQNTPAIKPTYS